jgi:cold shock CspA family protein
MERDLVRASRTINLDKFNEPNASRSAIGTVKRVPKQGHHYGFLTLRGISSDVFVPQRIIKESGFADAFVESAQVRCDITHCGERGWRAVKIHHVSPK